MSDEQIKYMVNRFLQWRLPENFNPDGGISFKRDYNENTPYPMKHEPVGTNLFDYTQAEEMVRFMLDGLPAAALAEKRPAGNQAGKSFQQRVYAWTLECFGQAIADDKVERNHRFLEESLELVQALGCTQSEAHQLVEYVFSRPSGNPNQECGGVRVTLAALCNANQMDARTLGEAELARVWKKIDVIRAKQAAKPKYSPLSEPMAERPQLSAEQVRQIIDGDGDWEERENKLRALLTGEAEKVPPRLHSLGGMVGKENQCNHITLVKQAGPMDGRQASKRYICKECGESFHAEIAAIAVNHGAPARTVSGDAKETK